jgi:flagellar biosynthesis/type III secretory pathway M-ring protein FliF/YscJ
MKYQQGELRIKVRELGIISVIISSLLIAIFIMVWGKIPDYRPLVQDLRLTNAVKIADVLDQNSVLYFADIKNHMLYVDTKDIVKAKLELAKIGIVIDYPNIKMSEDLNESFKLLESQLLKRDSDIPLYQQKWFYPVIKLIISMLVVITLILSIVRPALKTLLYPNDNE